MSTPRRPRQRRDTTPTRLLSAAAAASQLGIKPATLYAYVSRGRLTAFSRPDRRGSWFDPEQIDVLGRRARGPAERRPDVRIPSAVTLIERGRYWYRGVDPAVCANRLSFERVAELLWTGREGTTEWPVDARAVSRARRGAALLPAHAGPTERLRVIVSHLATGDPWRSDLRPEGALATARRLMADAVAALVPTRDGSIADRVALWVANRRLPGPAVWAIERALIVMADHELAASTVAVRVAASFRADPYAAVLAGLGVMTGTLHGGASRVIEELLRDMAAGARGREPALVMSRWLSQAGAIPGFGHPLYPDGDPRVEMLLRFVRPLGSLRHAEALRQMAQSRGVAPANLDFALAALTHVLKLPVGSGEALFTVARMAGWLAHALEEYAERTDFRLRAVYTGPRPEEGRERREPVSREGETKTDR